MANRRRIPGMLPSFLGALSNRCTERDGYWLFGFIVKRLDTMHIDLLAAAAHGRDAETQLACAARARFLEQLAKAGVDRECVVTATLTVQRGARQQREIRGVMRRGWIVKLAARVQTDLGAVHEPHAELFAAPHDSRLESRSVRAAEPPGTS